MSLSPGWYPDQDDDSYERYWNGVEWRDRRPRGAARRWEADDAGAEPGGSPVSPAWNAEGSQPSLARGDAYEDQGWNSQSSLARGGGLSKSRRRREPMSTLVTGILLIVIILPLLCFLVFGLVSYVSTTGLDLEELGPGFAILGSIAVGFSVFLCIGIVNVVRWFSSRRRRR